MCVPVVIFVLVIFVPSIFAPDMCVSVNVVPVIFVSVSKPLKLIQHLFTETLPISRPRASFKSASGLSKQVTPPRAIKVYFNNPS